MAPPNEHDPTTELLKSIKRAAAQRDKLKDKLAEAEAEVSSLIKDGFAAKIPGQTLAAAAGLSKPRAYQIRDDRR
ncbi:hypothetical protein [Mycolicibacterium sp.]|uniref:hypothetical protein n=1 Tax=Mycolicibacterium sp. TaxID=2320850 RepID=UPI0037C4F4B7